TAVRNSRPRAPFILFITNTSFDSDRAVAKICLPLYTIQTRFDVPNVDYRRGPHTSVVVGSRCLDSKPFNYRRLFFVIGSMKNKTKLNVPLPLVVRLIERLPIRPVLTVTAVSVLNHCCGPFRNRRLIALPNQVISLDSRSSVD